VVKFSIDFLAKLYVVVNVFKASFGSLQANGSSVTILSTLFSRLFGYRVAEGLASSRE
jgi:hypothetical protein